MADGQEQINFRLSTALKEATVGLREAVPMAEVLAAVLDVWGRNPNKETFLATLQRLASQDKIKESLREESKRIGVRNQAVTLREKELVKIEEESRERLAKAEGEAQERLDQLNLQTETSRNQYHAVLARTHLSVELIKEIRNAFKVDYPPTALAALARLAQTLQIDPSKAAEYFRQFGGLVATIKALEVRKAALTTEIEQSEDQVSRLRGEIRSLLAQKSALVGEVSAALVLAKGEFTQATASTVEALTTARQDLSAEATAVLAKLEETTGTARQDLSTETSATLARLEESTNTATARIETVAQALADYASKFPELVARELIEPYSRLMEMGVLADALDGSPDINRLAVAARLLKAELEQNGDTALPKESGEYGQPASLSWVARKLWILAVDTRSPLPKEIPAEDGRPT